MQGLELNTEVAPVINAALDAGLDLINAGTKIIRFLPPLVIEKEDVDTMITVLKEGGFFFRKQNFRAAFRMDFSNLVRRFSGILFH